jgi:uncharacterized protein YacL
VRQSTSKILTLYLRESRSNSMNDFDETMRYGPWSLKKVLYSIIGVILMYILAFLIAVPLFIFAFLF